MLMRATVEGLFGYTSRRALGVVRVKPQFPTDWDRASLKLPDVTISFARQAGIDRYDIELADAAVIELEVPVHSQRAVKVDSGTVSRGWGQPKLTVLTPGPVKRISIQVPYDERFSGTALSSSDLHGGDYLKIAAIGGRVTGWRDPQQVMDGAFVRDGLLLGKLSSAVGNKGNEPSTLILEVSNGAASWNQLVLVTGAPSKEPPVAAEPVHWSPVVIKQGLDNALTDLFKQKYLSPRPKTMSAQIGVDGFSWWTATFWGVNPPTIGTALVPPSRLVETKSGVSFVLGPSNRNIGFTSFWDNWPTRRVFDVHQSGSHVALLLAGATNQMQTGIANGRVIFRYSDGVVVSHDIEHPRDFWDVAAIYSYADDAFSLPNVPPQTVQLDENTRAVAFVKPLRLESQLVSVELETLSQEVTIGLMAISVAQQSR